MSEQMELFEKSFSEQFRMSKLQVLNWGTFSQLHEIPISRKGFLFIGRSGSGKSTLLDAIAALLVPPRWIDFNAAARESERSSRDRNLISYVRGAWAEQKEGDTGSIATQYLRNGTSWSALALTYANEKGETITIAQILSIKGNSNNNNDIKRHFFVFNSAFDLKELSGFDLDIRKLKQRLGDGAFIYDEFKPYADRFCRSLGIESDRALRLLHKTQSAKNLGDLNTFLRDFMLDKPGTFDAAERLVTEFAELSEAHHSVVTARKQIHLLAPACEQYNEHNQLLADKQSLEQLKSSLDTYKEMVRRKLLTQKSQDLETQIDAATGDVKQKELDAELADLKLKDLEAQHRDLGGEKITSWEREIVDLEKQRDQRLVKMAQAKTACQALGWQMAASAEAFALMTNKAKHVVENWQIEASEIRDKQMQQGAHKAEVAKRLEATAAELQALRRQPSNIPAQMLDMRQRLSDAVGLSEQALPFVGELLEVKAAESAWEGAIERLCHSFALSLLVEERHYNKVSAYVNSTDLRGKLIYYLTVASEKKQRPAVPFNSVITKLNIKEGTHKQWLEEELKSRFDYLCVTSMQAMRSEDRAITQEGMIRHGKTRHEKDDRRTINDRRNFVLGFDNLEKRNLFEQAVKELQNQLAAIDVEIAAMRQAERKKQDEALLCQTLSNLQWQEIDISLLLERMKDIAELLEQARKKNNDLEKLAKQRETQRKLLQTINNQLIESKVKCKKLLDDLAACLKQLNTLTTYLESHTISDEQHNSLHKRFCGVAAEVATLESLDRQAVRVERELSSEAARLAEKISALKQSIEQAFLSFKQLWPSEGSEIDATLQSAADFLAILRRLEADGLPAYEQRFFELLETQSHQNLAALNTHLIQARKAIHERMGFVNESLSRAHFNPGTYLYIQISDRQLVQVREFKQEINNALDYAWSDDREISEKRFQILQQLVKRLASEEPEQKRWRELVLDVRQHVEFIGQEKDSEGKEVEVYRSGAGKSGGQRQKLATTCLAAALHYQLSRTEQGVPSYAAVVLDEAFDKADNEFTALAMNIFNNFGFQMIVATPLKSVMTLEPFVGGACFVDINDRKHSSVLALEYDTESQQIVLESENLENEHLESKNNDQTAIASRSDQAQTRHVMA